MSKPNIREPQRSQTKKAQVIGLLKRKSGATIAQLNKKTGWQAHTIRAALTRLRQEGYQIGREREAGSSRYRILAQGKAD